jgi:hypothetical protein
MSDIQLSEKEAAELQQYVEQSKNEIESLLEKNASLEARVAELEGAQGGEKVASEVTPFSFDEDKMTTLLDKLASLDMVPQESLPALRQSIENDPSSVLDFMGKIAEQAAFQPVQPMGRVEKEASATGNSEPQRASDRYWDEFKQRLNV